MQRLNRTRGSKVLKTSKSGMFFPYLIQRPFHFPLFQHRPAMVDFSCILPCMGVMWLFKRIFGGSHSFPESRRPPPPLPVYVTNISKPSITCIGCLTNNPCPESHTDFGGCMYGGIEI